jgi:restriction system protein
MITTKQPGNWKDLQIMVAEILTQCGFQVQVEQVLKTARGKKEVDVYATEEIKGRTYTIACECKRWNTDIPQEVVHSFRTVVQDLGCNKGYIITTSDFQKGAVETVDFTNIELLTWAEFQEKFIETWFEQYFVPTITQKLDPIMSYAEPLKPKWFEDMTDEDKHSFYKLKERYDGIAIIIMVYFSLYRMKFADDQERPRVPLPLIDRLKETNLPSLNIPEEILNEAGYLELLQKSIAFGETGIAAFRQLRDKYGIFPKEE